MDNGFCASWKQAAWNPTDDKFRVYSVNPAAKPAGFLNVCNAGSKVYWQGGGGVPAGVNPCLPDPNAEWLRKVLIEQDAAHQLRLQGSLLPSDRQNSRYNGVIGGVPQAFRVFAGPHMGATGNAGDGAFYIEVDALRQVQPAESPATAMPGGSASVLSLTTHEYFHELQMAWVRAKPGAESVVGSYLNESITSSSEVNLCLVDFPNEKLLPAADLRRDCVSAGKLGMTSGGPYREKHFLEPELNILAQPYESSLFFRYVAEQFAYPTGSKPHPKVGTDTAIPRDAEDPSGNLKALAIRKASDEGIDILGLILRDQATLKGSASSILDKTLSAQLGRSLDRVVLDLHTAMVLKDYNDTDVDVPASGGRWRFEWTHNQGYFSNTVLSAAKPFPVPFNNLNGFTMNPTTPTQVGDGLRRARRVHDSWFIAVGGVPARNLLGPGSSIVSPQPLGIGAYGGAYFSVSIDPADWAAAGKTKASFTATANLNVPYLRAFVISEPAPGKLVPTPVCQLGDDNTCPPTTLADGSIFFHIPVPVTATTRELLIVASGGPGPSQLSWSFGAVTPTLSLIEPTVSTQALIGSAAARRKFAVKLSYRDQNNKPIPMQVLQPAVLALRARDPLTGALCDLTGFQKWPLANGAIMVVASVPELCYPPTPSGTLDLEAEIQGHVAFQADALKYSDVPQYDAAVIVIDKSGSMNVPPEKLQAAQSAAKALVSSFIGPGVATTWAGVVAFDADAHTIKDMTGVTQGELSSFYSAIEGISAGGPTSIGDGLYEAQSILAKALDPNDAWKLFDRQSIVLLSDGKNSADAKPVDYYGAALGGPPTGLTNALEFAHGTDPNLSDSDGGGESDASEVAAGRDPRDPDDDATAAPELIPVAGNALVYLPSAMSNEGHVLVVERSDAPSGPFTRVAPDTGSDGWYAVDGTVANDQTYCYRMRADLGLVRSGWSVPACTRPRVDPVPPTVQVTLAPRLTHTRDVTIQVHLTDPASVSDGVVPPVDLGVFTSGVEAMRVWFEPGSRDSVQWQAPAEQIELRLPDHPVTLIRIQSRHHAGNLSDPVSVWISRPLVSALDRAIAREELAEDAIEDGDLDRARTQILASLPEISSALAATLKRLTGPGADKKVETRIHSDLAKVHGLKVAAVALLKHQTVHLARDMLGKALKLELEVAALADEKGIRL